MDTSAIASTTDASDSSMHDVSDSTPAPISHELKTFMSDIKEMFRNFTSQVNTKLDSVINEIAELKTDLEKTKTTVSDMEVSLTNNSDRLLTVEQKSLPDLRKYIDEKIVELDDKLLLSEIHERKQNLLVYGLPSKPNENVYDTAYDVFSHFLNIPKKDAMLNIPLVNAHRLPPAQHEGSSGMERQPPAVIIRFARIVDRDRILYAFEHQPRQREQTKSPCSSTAAAPSSLSRVTIRTDLPPTMKRERGRLSSIAYNLRKNNGLSTRIKVIRTRVQLQTRKMVRNGGTPERWSNWSEWM